MGYVDTQLFINGQWQQALEGRTLPVVNPATGSEIGRVGVRSRDPRIPESNTSCAVRLGWLVTHTIPPFLQAPNDTSLVGYTRQVDCVRPALPGHLRVRLQPQRALRESRNR